jgi:hypothetical protein
MARDLDASLASSNQQLTPCRQVILANFSIKNRADDSRPGDDLPG